MVQAAIALGSNLGDRRASLDRAVQQLRRVLPDLRVSAFIETSFVGSGQQPDYLNAAASASWGGTARGLLDVLLAIEHQAGRVRPFPEAPRTLDLDLILFGPQIVEEPGLSVPHPRFRDRGFVLEPLAQVAPDMRDPVSGRTVLELFRDWQEKPSCESR
jgi:2-amino-4-hydroxy-6-hydroxymethyldihydropteridine diphosphokinase